MSLPLIDARIKITPATDSVLDMQHILTGKDKSELMREVLHGWAEEKIRASILLHSALADKGILRDYEGVKSL